MNNVNLEMLNREVEVYVLGKYEGEWVKGVIVGFDDIYNRIVVESEDGNKYAKVLGKGLIRMYL